MKAGAPPRRDARDHRGPGAPARAPYRNGQDTSLPLRKRVRDALRVGQYALDTELMYGSGLRIRECCRLRVKDVDLERRQLAVRSGKGDQDRVTVLPERLVEPLRRQIARAWRLHEADLAAGLV